MINTTYIYNNKFISIIDDETFSLLSVLIQKFKNEKELKIFTEGKNIEPMLDKQKLLDEICLAKMQYKVVEFCIFSKKSSKLYIVPEKISSRY